MDNEVIIGLDFGNFYSYPVFIEGIDPETHAGGNVWPLLPRRYASVGIPSLFYKKEGSSPVVGTKITPRMEFKAKKLIKRHMGESFTMGGETFTYQQAATMVVQDVVRTANADLQKKRHTTTNKVSLAYPVTMSNDKYDLLLDAVEAATLEDGRHLEVVGAVLEPAAAALDYLCTYSLGDGGTTALEPQTVLVYDLGAGTFDATILSVYPLGIEEDGELRYYNERLSTGESEIGGQDFTDVVESLIMKAVMQKEEGPVTKSILDGIHREAEKTKLELTYEDESQPLLGGIECAPITRVEFEEASKGLLDATIGKTKDLYDRYCAERMAGDEDERLWRPKKIILTGGASAMPMVRTSLIKLFSTYGYTSDDIIEHDPSVAIATGAARYPILGRDRGTIIQHTYRDLGIRYVDRSGGADSFYIKTHIPKRSTIPYEPAKFNRSRTAYDDQTQTSFRVYEAKVDSPRTERIEDDWKQLGVLTYDFGRVVKLGTPMEERLIIDGVGRLRAQAQEADKPETLKTIRIIWDQTWDD